LKKRREGAPEPAKFLGHGMADNLSKGKTLDYYTDDADAIAKEALDLLKILNVHPEDMRGIGLHMQKLDTEKKKKKAESPIKMNPNQSIQKFFNKSKENIPQREVRAPAEVTIPSSNLDPLPPFSQLDKAVLDQLPLPMKRELELAYHKKNEKKKSSETRSSSLFTLVKKDSRKDISPVVTLPTQHTHSSASPQQTDEKIAEFRKVCWNFWCSDGLAPQS
jgi:hypothetical protein